MSTNNGSNNYKLRIYGGNKGRIGLLLCYKDNSFAGRIDFYPNGATLPQDYLWHPGSIGEYVVLHMPIDQFDSIMSIAREEKPLHLYINVNRGIGASTNGYGYLTTTDKEPIGEEEGTP